MSVPPASRPPLRASVVLGEVAALNLFVVALDHLTSGSATPGWWVALGLAVVATAAGAGFRYRQLRPFRSAGPRATGGPGGWGRAFLTGLSWLWRAREVEIASPLPVAEAEARLAAGVRSWRERQALAWSLSSSRIVVGRVRDDKVRLAGVRPTIRNSFTPVLRARLVAEPGGCRLVGRVGLVAFVRVMMLVMGGYVLLGVVLLLLLGPFVGPGESSWLAVTLGWTGGLLFLPVFAGSGGALGTKDAEFLLAWLQETLEGRDA